ncbi:hypothetical protein Glove_242g8 [Diversispora epigaea]|uniref:HNH domain-containing protein n=1 Tax=Diversispora epigaea TaxID=1348612 RepID=A0A397ICL7_9GLOM|nr:hypothetical protein Glove_242g8 [Diversispora epigaea]
MNKTNKTNSRKTTKIAKQKLETQKKLEKLILFKATFYQVLCDHNPNIIASDDADSIEYLAEQVWNLGSLEVNNNDDDNNNNNNDNNNNNSEIINDNKSSSLLSEQEIVTKIYEIVKDDFIIFEICDGEEKCLQICRDIIEKWNSAITSSEPTVSTIHNTTISQDSEEDDDDNNEEEEEEEEIEPGTCSLCRRHMRLSFHHLIPRMMHKRVVTKGIFTRLECNTRGIKICKTCHRCIHKMIPHAQLALKYNTQEMLLQHEGISKFVQWNSKQKDYRARK